MRLSFLSIDRKAVSSVPGPRLMRMRDPATVTLCPIDQPHARKRLDISALSGYFIAAAKRPCPSNCWS